MGYVKTTIFNNIKVADSYKIKSAIKFAMFIINDFSLYNDFPNNSITTNKRTFIDWCSTCKNLNVKASVYESYYSYHKPISVVKKNN